MPYEYDRTSWDVYGFVNGFALFGKKNTEGGYDAFFISSDGKTVISLSGYENVRNFSEGLAAVCKDGKWGYINTAGDLKIPCEYDFYYYEDYMDAQNGMVMLFQDGKWGYANTKGEIVAPPQYLEARPFSSKGTAVVQGEDGEYFAIDQTGKRLENKTDEPDKPVSAIDEKLTAEGYENIMHRDDGLIYLTKDNKYGFADERGEIVIPVEYDRVWGGPGLVFVVKDGKYGCINKKGETVIPLEFDWTEECEYHDVDYAGYIGVGTMMKGSIGVVYQNGRYGIFENPYFEEPKPAGLFSPGSGGTSASGGFPLLPVAGVLAVAVAGGLVLLKKKKRPQA